MVRCRASLDADQARLELCKEGLDLRTAKLAAEDLLPLSIDAVGVKNVLSDIEADCDWLHHLTFSISCPKTLPVSGRVMDAVHSIKSRPKQMQHDPVTDGCGAEKADIRPSPTT
jgi:hypothetical protein